jgi:hypothetical protein
MLKIVINRENRITTFEREGKKSEVPIHNIESALVIADAALSMGGTLEPSDLVAEAIILRTLRRVREGLYEPEEVELVVDGKKIGITEDGDLSQPFPGGFYEWRTKELF